MKPCLPLALVLLPLACRSTEPTPRSSTSTSEVAAPRPPAARNPSTAVQAISLSGRDLVRVPRDAAEEARLDGAVESARLLTEGLTASEADWIHYGRRLSAAGRYREAWDAFGRGRQWMHGRGLGAEDWRLLRYQGHRSITLRRFAEAEQLLEESWAKCKGLPVHYELRLDPDPATAYPVSYQHNIGYHLGVARHLQHDFAGASEAWQIALSYAENPDMLCGATHWAYMALRREGKHAEARALLGPITDAIQVRESKSYLKLCRFYQGRVSAEELLPASETDPLQRATLGYGLANWYWCEGQRERAIELWKEVADSTAWMAFGCIASEVELQRL